jgi:tetratricopeptide (TPR) repeat protein
MKTLAALLLLAATAAAQDEGAGDKALMERITRLEKTVEETADPDEKARLQAELRDLRQQAARARERRRGQDPENRERLKMRMEELNRILKEDPEDAQALLERSELKRRSGDVKGAEEDRAAAFKISPELKDRAPAPGQPRPPMGPNRPGGGPPWGQPGAERRFRPGAGEEDRPSANPDEVREWLKENEPETARQVARLEEEGRRQEAMALLMQAGERRREMEDVRRRDPQGYEKMASMRRLERESIELAEKVRQAPAGAARDEGVRKLNDLLGKLFDLREEARAREIVELKRRIEELEKSLSSRKAGKDRIVERRRKELLGEKIDEDW